MRDRLHQILKWILPFAVLGLLLVILGYGYVHAAVDQAERAMSEVYNQDITTLIQERLLPDEPVSITIDGQVFTDERDLKAITELIERIEWKWTGIMEGPEFTPRAGFGMEIELDFEHEKSEIMLPSTTINGHVYDGFIEGENAMNVLFSAIQNRNG